MSDQQYPLSPLSFHSPELTPSFFRTPTENSLETADAPMAAADWTTVRRLDAEVLPGGYELRQDIADALSGMARIDCRLCGGSGVNAWRNGGRTARVCKCVRNNTRYARFVGAPYER